MTDLLEDDLVVLIDIEPALPAPVDGAVAPDAGARRLGAWLRRGLGGLLLVLALVGVAIGAAVVFSGLAFGDDATRVAGDGLDVVTDVLDTTGAAIDGAEETLVTATDALESVSGAMTEFESGLGDVQSLLGDMSDVVGNDLADSIAGLRDAMPQLIDAGDVLDGTLQTLSLFGVPYDPSALLGDSFRELQGSLDPVPGRLRDEGTLLGQAAGDLADARGSIDRIGASLGDLRVELAGTAALFGRYRDTIERARTLVADLRSDVGRWSGAVRWILTVIGALVVLWQVVPAYLGVRLVRGLDPLSRNA